MTIHRTSLLSILPLAGLLVVGCSFPAEDVGVLPDAGEVEGGDNGNGANGNGDNGNGNGNGANGNGDNGDNGNGNGANGNGNGAGDNGNGNGSGDNGNGNGNGSGDNGNGNGNGAGDNGNGNGAGDNGNGNGDYGPPSEGGGVIDGNPSCEDLGYVEVLKIDPAESGEFPVGDPIIELAIDEDHYFGWTSSTGIAALIAKSTPAAVYWPYDPVAFEDADMHGPTHPEWHPNAGEPQGIGHVIFCE